MNTVVPCAYAQVLLGDIESISVAVDERVFPIQHLQPEILAEIFTFCLSTNDAGINHAPLLLCNVCSSWRALAISTPLLWADLNLHFESAVDSDADVQAIVDGIHTWLGRSGNLPLTIRFFYESESRVDNALQMCDALSKYASRWESVDIAAENTIFACWPNLHAVPLLRTLRIRSPVDSVPFTSAPSLVRVHAMSIHAAATPHIPWHQLVDLALTKWTAASTILKLIAWCPLLDSVYARISGFAKLPYRNPPIEHSALKNIKFCFEHDEYTVFESLVVPGLKSLFICDDTRISTRDRYSEPLIGFMNRSQCELRDLRLVRVRLNQHGLVEYLEHRSCRTLTSLRENNGRSQNVFDELLLRLTHVDGKSEDPLCPELTYLTLTCDPGNTSAGVLGRMILSRSRKTEKNRLGSIELFIDASCGLAETDQALLKRAEENGLNLCVNNDVRWRCVRDE